MMKGNLKEEVFILAYASKRIESIPGRKLADHISICTQEAEGGNVK